MNALEAICVLISNCIDHLEKYALYELQLSWTVLVFFVAFFKHPIVSPQSQVFPALCQIKPIYMSLFISSTSCHVCFFITSPSSVLNYSGHNTHTVGMLHERSFSDVLNKRKFDALHFCFRVKPFPYNISKSMSVTVSIIGT